MIINFAWIKSMNVCRPNLRDFDEVLHFRAVSDPLVFLVLQLRGLHREIRPTRIWRVGVSGEMEIAVVDKE